MGGLAFFAAPAAADIGWHGPVLGDDGGGLVGGDRRAVGIADDVGGAAVHDGPRPFGEVGGDDTEGAEVVLAALDHLDVVDARQLRVSIPRFRGGIAYEE